MQETDKQKLIGKIRALQAKTTANGCSEAEAMSAAAKVDELMKGYDLTVTEVDIKTSKHGTMRVDITLAGGTFKHPVQFALFGIEAFTDTKVYLKQLWAPNGALRQAVVVFGEQKDVEVAVYLTQLVRGAIDRAYEEYRDAERRRGNKKINPWAFRNAMAQRLGARLREMKQARDRDVAASTGTSLVVVKRQVVEDAFARLDVKLRHRAGKSGRTHGDYHAAMAGRSAGDRVQLNPGVTGGAARARLA